MRRHRPALATRVTAHQAVACEPHQAAARPARSTRPTARTRAPSGAQSGEPSGGREPGLDGPDDERFEVRNRGFPAVVFDGQINGVGRAHAKGRRRGLGLRSASPSPCAARS